ncbi:hypothetical protein PM082_003394 [Marasmius tenuissimus]|nr:hypothetical protein PM082_003394 [Marasmius tenuissimus]
MPIHCRRNAGRHSREKFDYTTSILSSAYPGRLIQTPALASLAFENLKRFFRISIESDNSVKDFVPLQKQPFRKYTPYQPLDYM